jgi:hypothetical protein
MKAKKTDNTKTKHATPQNVVTYEELLEKTKWAKTSLPSEDGVPYIFEYIERTLGVTEEELKSQYRTGPQIEARRIFNYMTKAFFEMSLSASGRYINRDHGTVHNSLKECNNLLQTDKIFRQKVNTVFDMMKQLAVEYDGDDHPVGVHEIEVFLKERNVSEVEIEKIKTIFTDKAIKLMRFPKDEVVMRIKSEGIILKKEKPKLQK